MVFPCCMPVLYATILAMVLSIGLSTGLVGVSGWLLKHTYDYRNEIQSQSITSTQTGNFGGSYYFDPNQDQERTLQLKLYCYGATAVCGIIQLLVNVYLCWVLQHLIFRSTSEYGGIATRLYTVVNTFIMLTLGASFACFLTTTDDKKEDKVRYFLTIVSVDFLFLGYLMFLNAAYIRY